MPSSCIPSWEEKCTRPCPASSRGSEASRRLLSCSRASAGYTRGWRTWGHWHSHQKCSSSENKIEPRPVLGCHLWISSATMMLLIYPEKFFSLDSKVEWTFISSVLADINNCACKERQLGIIYTVCKHCTGRPPKLTSSNLLNLWYQNWGK